MARGDINVRFLGDLDDLLREAKIASSRMEGVGKSVKDVGGDFKELEDKSSRSMKAMRDNAGRVRDAVGAIAAGAGTAVVAGTFEDATVSAGKLRAQLGLTKDEAAGVESVATRVFKNNFGENMQAAFEATGLVQQGIGGIGEELQGRVEDVFRITDAFGHLGADNQILVEGVRAMKSAFPGEDEGKLLDRIAAAFQAGAGTSGDLLDTMQEYPPQFAAIGLGAGDMTNFLTTGMQSGARNTDLLADAVKEFGIRVKTVGDTGQEALKEIFPDAEAQRLIGAFAKGGEAGREAFFTTLEGLNAVEDPQIRYNTAIGLFGTKAEDLVGVLDKMTPQFLAMKDETAGVTDATATLDQQYTGFGAKLESIKRGFQTAILDKFSAFGPIAEGGVESLGSVGTAMLGAKALGLNFGGAMGKIGGAVTTVFGGIGKAAGALFANPVGIAILAIIVAATLVWRHWDKISGFIKAVWQGLKDAFAVIADFIGNTVGKLVGWIQKNWDLLLPIFLGPIGLVILVVRRFGDDIWNFITDKVGAVLGWLHDRWNGFIEFFKGLPGRIADAAKGMWDGIKEAFKAAINFVIRGWNSLSFRIPKIPAWVPLIGGKGGFTLQVPQIPELAHGGIVTRPTLAMLGERGPEAVIPLNRSRGSDGASMGEIATLLRELIAAIESRPVVLEADRREIARVVDRGLRERRRERA